MKRLNTVILHVCACVAFLFLPYLFSSDGAIFRFPNLDNGHDRTYLGIYFLLLAFFYLNYFWLIPKFYFHKKFYAYFLVIAVVAVFFIWFSNFIDRPMDDLLAGRTMGPPPDMPLPPDGRMHGRPDFGPPTQYEHTLLVFLIGIIGSLLLSINKRLQKTENEKVQAELSLLKAQINPHFLFNTLNNIYSLALTNDERTADSVIQLSEIMRYIMKNSNENIIALDQEISYLNNYISLQKSRLGNTAKVSYRVSGNLIGKSVAPLILISFIENAFKHGVNPDENSEIDIQISTTDSELKLHVFNKKVTTVQSESGMGMRNTMERLELLYPERYALHVSDDSDSHTVELMLQL